MTAFPKPPDLDPTSARALVAYAEQVARYFEQEIVEASARGLDVSPLPRLVDGWAFVATALAESYDITM